MRNLLGDDLYNTVSAACGIRMLTEIRVRLGKEIMLKTRDEVIFLAEIADRTLIEHIVNTATGSSRYAYEEELAHGYLTYRGGVRIGVVGEFRQSDKIPVLREIYSLCIRIPHEVIGCAACLKEILDNFDSTLLISPPYGGKTTLLRDIARLVGMRYDTLIIDEREEICGKNLCLKIGARCDVIQGIPKDMVIEGVIRAMAPQIVVCDELYGEKDFQAVERLRGAGIKVLATYHGDCDIAKNSVFCNRIILSSIPHPGSIVSIIRGTAAV